MASRDQLNAERLEALIELVADMLEEMDGYGGGGKGRGPQPDHVRALKSVRDRGDAEKVRNAAREERGPPTFSRGGDNNG